MKKIKKPNAQVDKEFEEELKNMLQTKFPSFFKKFLNEFAETKFYKKTLEKRQWGYGDVTDYSYFFDWKAPRLSPYKAWTDGEKLNSLLEYGIFGAIPHYQYDELKVIVIDFKNKEAYLERGMATKPYASYVLKHKQEIPKYMKPLIEQLWIDYDNYIKEEEINENQNDC